MPGTTTPSAIHGIFPTGLCSGLLAWPTAAYGRRAGMPKPPVPRRPAPHRLSDFRGVLSLSFLRSERESFPALYLVGCRSSALASSVNPARRLRESTAREDALR